MNLEELRSQIDVIDDELAALFAKRMELAASIAKVKSTSGVSIEQKSREEEVLRRAVSSVPQELSAYAEKLFRQLIELSKEYQQLSGERSDK